MVREDFSEAMTFKQRLDKINFFPQEREGYTYYMCESLMAREQMSSRN